VLDEVGDAELVVVLEDRSGVDHEAELRTLLREGVAADEISEPVRQAAAEHGAVEGERRIGGLRADLWRECGAGQDERDEQ
jgi:hypothetical protein